MGNMIKLKKAIENSIGELTNLSLKLKEKVEAFYRVPEKYHCDIFILGFKGMRVAMPILKELNSALLRKRLKVIFHKEEKSFQRVSYWSFSTRRCSERSSEAQQLLCVHQKVKVLIIILVE